MEVLPVTSYHGRCMRVPDMRTDSQVPTSPCDYALALHGRTMPRQFARPMSDDLDLDRRSFAVNAALGLAAAHCGMLLPPLRPLPPAPLSLPVAGESASLGKATTWINPPPLSEAALRGKVVLVDVWTYTCINWLRTLPYVRAWAVRYKEQGLVVIGVHTPEFSFEEGLDNVRRAAKQMGVTYPVAIDNDRAIWRGFANHYWPALYFIDAAGRVRDRHFGEGNYEES